MISIVAPCHLLAPEGAAAVADLNGIFAFCFWDRATDRFVLARDPCGQKPLFYRLAPDRLVFASDLGSLLLDPSAPRRYGHRCPPPLPPLRLPEVVRLRDEHLAGRANH